MKRLAILAAAAVLAGCAREVTEPESDLINAAAIRAPEIDFCLTLLHNNDGESKLRNAGTGLESFGGVARFATVVEQLREEANDRGRRLFPRFRLDCNEPGPGRRGVMLVSSGDNYLAGPDFNASLVKGKPYYDGIALDLIGYDALAIGNHEFDFGPEVFANFVLSFPRSEAPFISANLDVSGEPSLAGLPEGRIVKSAAYRSFRLFNRLLSWPQQWEAEGTGDEDEYAQFVSSRIVLRGGRLIGIVGATTPLLKFISSPRNVIASDALAPAIQREVDRLTARGVNKIILISHLQSLTEDLALIPQLRRVDIAVAGGGSEVLANPGDLLVPGDVASGPYPTVATDAEGKPVQVITTEGGYRYVGRLVAGFDRQGRIVQIGSASGPVRVAGAPNPDAVEPDAAIQAQVVEPVAAYVAAQAANIVAQSDVILDGRRASVRTIETNLGDLIGDATLWQAQTLAAAFGQPAPVVSLQNSGGIRNDSQIPAGPLSELTTFSILPFANFVCIVPNVSRSQFKEILENAVSRVAAVDGRFAQIGGFRFRWDPAGTAQTLDASLNVVVSGTRVREVVLQDGTVIVQNGAVVPGAPITIATIDFLARGGDQYPFRGAAFTTLGVTYQQMLLNYLTGPLGGVVSGATYPVGGLGRITQGS